MKVLITGGLGHIGLATADMFIKNNWEPIIFDIRRPMDMTRDHDCQIVTIRGNVSNGKISKSLLEDLDGIIHLAAISRVIWGHENPGLCINVNIQGTLNLLEAISKLKRKPWLIFGSSREVYGEPKSLPVAETAPLNPLNVYGASKVTGEILCKDFSEKYHVPTIILRFSNVYGSPNDHFTRVIPQFIINALLKKDIIIQGGKQVFDFTHISDTVDCIMKATRILNDSENGYFNFFHVLTGNGTTLQDLISIIGKFHPIESEIQYRPARDYDVVRFYGNPDKAQEELGFVAKTDLQTGVKETINSFKKLDLEKEIKKQRSNYIPILKQDVY